MLRIATSMIYQQSSRAISDRQVALAKVQQQMATGNRILTASDDPVGSARLLSLNEELDRYDQYQRNIDLANGRLNVEETALKDAGEIFQRARELTIQAGNDTLNDSDRKNIAKEIRQLQEQLVSLANTQDGNGEYVFGGFKSDTQPFTLDKTTHVVKYAGDQGQRLIQAGPSLDIPVGDSGQAVFQMDPSDASKGMFATLHDLATALETKSGQELHDAMTAGLVKVDQGLEQLTNVRAQVGARLNALDAQESANGDFTVHLQQTMSDIGDLDYADAATRLSQETLVLQAAQQSFLRIQDLSLFNYL